MKSRHPLGRLAQLSALVYQPWSEVERELDVLGLRMTATFDRRGTQGMLVEADAWSPGAPDAPPPSTPPANAVDLYETVESLGLDVATIAPVHGRGAAPFEELATFIGR